MRILGFSEFWPKLGQSEFTTFRFEHRGKPYQVGELFQIVYKPRSKNRRFLAVAELIKKEPRDMSWCGGDKMACQKVTNEEANQDGFPDKPDKLGYFSLWEYLWDFYGGERLLSELMYKLTLRWLVSSPAQPLDKGVH